MAATDMAFLNDIEPPTADEDESSDDEEVTTISEVFADMLLSNEDILQAAAECEPEKEIEGILAYQQVLHRNLMEMADLVDSMFGIYNVQGDEQDEQNVDQDDLLSDDAKELISGHGTDSSQSPVRIKRSVLVSRLKVERRRRLRQRMKKMWDKMRRQVRNEENVNVVMSDAAQRMAMIAVSAGKSGQQSSSEAGRDDQTEPSSLPNTQPTSSAEEDPSPNEVNPDVIPPPEDLIVALSDATNETSVEASPSPPPDSTDATTVPEEEMKEEPPATIDTTTNPVFAGTANGFLSVPLQLPVFPPMHQNPIMIHPQLAQSAFPKVPLPPTSSSLNMFYPMAPPPVFSTTQLPTVCVDCAPRNKNVHECRNVLKHVAPPLMIGGGMWPMQFAPPVPPAVRSVPSMRASSMQFVFRRVCDDCKKQHKSLHYCRKTLAHTAPEWHASGDAEPRRRRGRKQAAARVEIETEDVSC
ncbi:hypothetical protein Poli38472_010256 [Pythium oligandrum]|uniref:Uncharacterized protein n=1 Tax=Pythium oligandrum TaxID=41045 RepID=A0A8K1FGH2_PYTOL|nr:hypothetical protein Poli38472_010256 [Pythium oligandrum]|eukprot:TMW58697.1 hypothetical protein Poli38472_010256 [Pythium oligandrum]